MALKKWRKIYQTKKLNLTKAAKVVGISKKSLDDYYLIVRTGELFGFDFSLHLHHKMGELRSFTRKFEYKVAGKLSKRVKCFELVPDFNINEIIENYKESSHPTLSEME